MTFTQEDYYLFLSPRAPSPSWSFKLHDNVAVKMGVKIKIAPRETENNAYAKLWDDKQRALWYVIVFFVVVNSTIAR